MSNVVTCNPIFVDTPGSILTSPATIKAILWVNDSASSIAVDNDVKIRDKENGNVICAKRAKAAGDGLKISFGNGIHVQGIYVSELDGGILLIYI